MAFPPPQGMPQGAPPMPPPMPPPIAAGGAPPQPPPGQTPPALQAGLQGLPMPGLGLPSVFQDVSQELPHHWQMVDAATRILKRALKTGGFYQEPEARAHLEQCARDLDQLVHRYSDRGATMGPQKGPDQPEPAAQPDQGEGNIDE